jgi:hypothetical protein
MFALFGAKFIAADAAPQGHSRFNARALMALAVATTLSACMPAIVPLVGREPADPAAKVAGVDFKSTIAPYTSMRPSTLAPWRERNESAAPQPKSDR